MDRDLMDYRPQHDQYRDPAPAGLRRAVMATAALGLALMVGAGAALAQSASSESHANSNSSASVNVTSQSGASAQGGAGYAQGGAVIIEGGPARSRSTVDYRGDYTVRSAPQVAPPSMSSGHPCGLAQSGGISIIGGGGSWGGASSDDACLLGQMGMTDAAVAMIAKRNSEACQALRSAGNIPKSSICTSAEKRAAAAAPAPKAIPTCPAGATWDGKGCYAKRLSDVKR